MSCFSSFWPMRTDVRPMTEIFLMSDVTIRADAFTLIILQYWPMPIVPIFLCGTMKCLEPACCGLYGPAPYR